jgi:3-dehydroquinate synthetase
VSQGLLFAAELSKKLKILNPTKHKAIIKFLNSQFGIKNNSKVPFLKRDEFETFVSQDKKNEIADQISFVLLKDFGKPVFKNVTSRQVTETLRELKWLE